MRKVPSWDEHFMDVAKVISNRSKDPSTQVGALIVDSEKKHVAEGYNGMIAGWPENDAMWQRPTKYLFVVHAEANALIQAKQSLKGMTLYSTLYPCQECAKLIAAAGIRRVVYDDNKSFNEISEQIFELSGIEVVRCQKSSPSPD